MTSGQTPEMLKVSVRHPYACERDILVNQSMSVEEQLMEQERKLEEERQKVLRDSEIIAEVWNPNLSTLTLRVFRRSGAFWTDWRTAASRSRRSEKRRMPWPRKYAPCKASSCLATATSSTKLVISSNFFSRDESR